MLRPCPMAVSRCLVPSRHTLLSKSPAGGFRGSEFSLQRNCGSVRFAYVSVYFGCFFVLSCGTRTSKATITKSAAAFPVLFRSRTAGVPKSKSDFVQIHFTSLHWLGVHVVGHRSTALVVLTECCVVLPGTVLRGFALCVPQRRAASFCTDHRLVHLRAARQLCVG